MGANVLLMKNWPKFLRSVFYRGSIQVTWYRFLEESVRIVTTDK